MVSNLIFEHSPWWLPVGILAGAVYAGLLYFKVKVPWSRSLNMSLAIFRFLLVTLICLLLISPFLNQTQNRYEKPLVVLAVDNSESMKLTQDSASLQSLASSFMDVGSELSVSGFEVKYQSLEKSSITAGDNLSFNYPKTNLSDLLKSIQNDYEGRNLASVLLMSDGIYNQGTAPVFMNLTYPVYSLGVGDTIPKKDLIIKNILYNKITYQGNQFPIVAEILNEGFLGEEVFVSVVHKGKVLDTRSVRINRNNQLLQVQFQIDADENGLQRYSVSLERKDGEYTYANNVRHAYIDVIDGKENILIVAPSPHPDIKSFSAALEKNENYEVSLFIPGIYDYPAPEVEKEIDLIIYNQVPDRKRVINPYMDRLKKLNLPSLFITGSQTNILALNNEIYPVQINARRNEGDLITAVHNQNFGFFQLSQELEEFLGSYPPVRVPFGQIIVDRESNVLLYQRVGSIETTRPLLLFRNSDNRKSGILFGEGLWRWRLFEYSRTDDTRMFDELVLKSVQFLASKEDRRKFRVYPQENEFFENEPVVLEVEAYNSLYEPVYGIKVDLTLQNENKENSYTFVTSESNSRFTIRDLESGVYNYKARAIVNEQPEQVNGQFIIKTMDLEAISLTADHRLLRQLSSRSGGKFYLPQQLEEMTAQVINLKPPDIIHSSVEFLPLINLLWVFLLLIALVSSEWFLRKYNGGY